tara:strand:+ start:427 stop:576 length:150 start_codon:yes stop_codon:yes gene_type:complete
MQASVTVTIVILAVANYRISIPRNVITTLQFFGVGYWKTTYPVLHYSDD